MKETFTPAVTMQLLIQQNPSWTFWNENFISISNQLMAKVGTREWRLMS